MGIAGETWMLACIAAPLGLALLAHVGEAGAGRAALAVAAVLVPVSAVGLLGEVVSGGSLRHPIGGWSIPLGIELRADAISALFILMTAVVGALVSVYAASYFREADGPASGASPDPASTFRVLWLMLWAALNALFLAADAFNVYVTLEMVTLASVGLVALRQDDATATRAALRYLVFALAGSLLYLVGVSLLYAAHATLDLATLGAAMEGGWVDAVAVAALSTGLILKAALFPLHFWLPGAHGSAPPPVSAALSALVVKSSFYLMLRLWLEVFPDSLTDPGGPVLTALGASAVIFGSLQAIRTPRLKLLVAYSTVAQIGYLFLVLPLAARSTAGAALVGVVTLAIAHAFAKSAAFLAAGSVLSVAGHDRIAELRRAGAAPPTTLFAFAVAGVSLMGLPPSGGFAGKWLLVTEAIGSGQWHVVAVLLLGGLLAAAYVFRVVGVAFLAGERTSLPAARPRAVLEWTALALALSALFLGFALEPMSAWLAEAPPLRPTLGGEAAP